MDGSHLDAQPRPAFEVVSIKPNTSSELGARISTQPSGRLIMTNVPVSAIVLTAYELADVFQVDGLPEWSRTERFNVVAQAPAGVPIAFPGQKTALPRMLRACSPNRTGLSALFDISL